MIQLQLWRAYDLPDHTKNTPQLPAPVVTHSEILTVDELAAFLKCSRRSIYELTRSRGQARHETALPVLRLPCGMRFLRRDIEAWIEKIASVGRIQ